MPRTVHQGGKMPDEISDNLAVRVLMGFDGLANLQQQLTRVMRDFAKVVKQEQERK